MRAVRVFLPGFLLLMSLVGVACRKQSQPATGETEEFKPMVASEPPAPAPVADQTVVRRAEQDFALRFLRQAKPKGNFVSSPQSISMALSMVRQGARGDTDRELATLLGQTVPAGDVDRVYANRLFDWQTPGEKITLRVANSLWGNGFSPDYATRIGRDYLAPVKSVDWNDSEGVSKRVNRWVAAVTENMIPAVLDPGDVTSDTMALLVNATYFNGAWEAPFDADRTWEDKFTLSDGKVVNVPTMSHRDHGHLLRVNFADGVAVSLPFRGQRFQMTLVLPKTPDGLAKLEENLTTRQLEEWMSPTEREQIDLRLPKFQFATRRLLNDDLKGMGAKLMFGPGADFSGMTSDKWFVGKVIHEARVEVDEAGAKAAAATVVEMKKSEPPQSRLIRFDHPFLFLITDTKTKTVLFLGRVTDPREN